MELRRLTGNDLDAVMRIENELFEKEAWSSKTMASELSALILI